MMAARQTASLRGQLLRDEPMARHTSWRVGGPADHYYQPADLEDLVTFIKTLPDDEFITWLGLGSNLLVRDGGIRGTVIACSGALHGLSLLEPNVIRAEVGVASAKVARFSVNHKLRGAEFLSGIPGTIGGALAMNAGAFGCETWEVVTAVETLDHAGNTQLRQPPDYRIAYRSVIGPENEWFLAAHFKLQAGSMNEGKSKIRSLLAKRGESQPTQLANAGSVFKNPPGDYSARLIEASGLKDFCIGQACVSAMHANFIINKGEARAADIESLIAHVRDVVREKQGVELEPEVRIIGEQPEGQN